MPAPDPHIDVTESPSELLYVLRGQFDTDDDLNELSARYGEPTRKVTVVDVRNVTFCATHVLAWFLWLQRHATTHGHDLTVRGPLQPPVARLFDITGTAEHFNIAR